MSESLQPKPLSLTNSTIVDLEELIAHPSSYSFITFRPNLKKLILSGTQDTEHISILWYTTPDGSVGQHYHSMTESVYTIQGTQRDAKGVYPTSSWYFNPPGSRHKISDSSGFFLIAYASPPDFSDVNSTNANSAKDYTPIQIKTAAADLQERYPFEIKQDAPLTYSIPLNPQGKISARIIAMKPSQGYQYKGNYLLVLKGRCHIDRTALEENRLIVSKIIEPQPYSISTSDSSFCLVLGLSFLGANLSTHSLPDF